MSEVLGPLGEEAALVPSAQVILTRHRTIADEARKILERDYDLNFDGLFEEIISAAVALRREVDELFNLHLYEDLPKYFFVTNRKELGLRLAKIIMQNTNNARVMTRLCNFIRENGYPDIALKFFRNKREDMKRDRGFYHEWATAEGKAGNHGLSVWIDSLSLADGIERNPPNNNQAKLSLGGLGVALEELYNKYNDTIFLEAEGACGQLGLKLSLDETAKGYFKKYQAAIMQARLPERDDATAFEGLMEGISKAWKVRENDLPDYVPTPDSLQFEGFKYLLKIRTKKPIDKAKIIFLPEKN